jgi:hypothetical protein
MRMKSLRKPHTLIILAMLLLLVLATGKIHYLFFPQFAFINIDKLFVFVFLDFFFHHMH